MLTTVTSPHNRGAQSTPWIMRQVLLACVPGLLRTPDREGRWRYAAAPVVTMLASGIYALKDGAPAGDPVVELAGFGLEDTHSTATNLQFNVDGWLYGANGSTTTGNVGVPGGVRTACGLMRSAAALTSSKVGIMAER